MPRWENGSKALLCNIHRYLWPCLEVLLLTVPYTLAYIQGSNNQARTPNQTALLRAVQNVEALDIGMRLLSQRKLARHRRQTADCGAGTRHELLLPFLLLEVLRDSQRAICTAGLTSTGPSVWISGTQGSSPMMMMMMMIERC